MSKIIDDLITNSKDGLLRTSDVEKNGGLRQDIKKYVDNNKLYKVGRGLYQIADEWEDELYTLHIKYSKGIVSCETALYIHGLTDLTPSQYYLTFPQGYHSESLKDENVIIKRVVPAIYELGIEEGLSFNNHKILVYDVERTLCDIVKGEGSDIQIVKEAMKRYARDKSRNINKLINYAEHLHVKKKVLRYMEILL